MSPEIALEPTWAFECRICKQQPTGFCDPEDKTEPPHCVAHPTAPIDCVCKVPPPGWTCSRQGNHSGPCAASPDAPPVEKFHIDIGRPYADDRMAAQCDCDWMEAQPELGHHQSCPAWRSNSEDCRACFTDQAREFKYICPIHARPGERTRDLTGWKVNRMLHGWRASAPVRETQEEAVADIPHPDRNPTHTAEVTQHLISCVWQAVNIYGRIAATEGLNSMRTGFAMTAIERAIEALITTKAPK